MNKNKQNLKETGRFKAHRATITLLAGLMFIFFIPLISGFEFDNLKSYDEETKTITITNSFLLLYPLGEVATIKLDTPLVYNVIRGKNRLVAEFTINNIETYTEGVFDDMEFYDTKNNMEKFDRQFNYKYKTFYDVEVLDYETICKEKEVIGINGTYIEKYDCSKNLAGSHIEQRIKWNDFNKKAELPKGEITLGIFTDVLPNERVEWIPTLFGVEINEWAVWTEALNVDLVAYWDFEEGSGTNAIDRVAGVYNFSTFVNDPTYTTGKVGSYAINLDGDDYLKLTNLDPDAFTEFSWCIWGYAKTTDKQIISNPEDGTNQFRTFNIDGNTKLKAVVYNGTDTNFRVISDEIINLNSWQFFCITAKENDYLKIYWNGTHLKNVSMTNLGDASSTLQLGTNVGANGEFWNGYLDEFGYWNRSLTSSEITQLWNEGTGMTYTIFLPEINITYPENITYNKEITELNYTVQTGTEDSCWYSLDNGVTNSSRQDWGINWTGLTSTEGSNTWIVYCNDTAGSIGSNSVDFIIDTTSPSINITFPLNISYSINVSAINHTYTELNCDSVWYSLDDGVTNSSRENCGINWTGLTSTEGSNTWIVYINDSVNNENSSSVTFYKDTTPPSINITFPLNNSNHSINTIDINYTVSDTNLDSCWYSNDSMTLNTTITCGTNITSIIWSEGQHNVTIWTNDTLNNVNSSSVTFTIDTTLPTISITSPTGQIGSHVLGSNLSANWTISDTNLDSCWLDYNSINTTLTCGDNNFSFTPILNKQDLIIWANDTFGNTNFNTTNWTYNFLENNATFNATSYETSQETFMLNLTTDLTVLSIDSILNYNGTEYVSTTTCTNGNCLLSNTLDLPLISAAAIESHSFHWNFTIFNGTDSIETISSNRIQNVSIIYLEQCNATYPTKTLNFTVYDEQNLSKFNTFQFDGTFDFWIGSGTVKKNNSFGKNISEMNLCLSPNATIKTDATIDYDEATGANYTNRFYYFDAHEINHTLQHIKMYLLKSASATSFILKVQDENLLPVADALIEIHRYYAGEGIYRIVQITKTDDNGKSIGFFQTETVDYKFIIKKNGEILLTTGKQKVVPEVSPFTLTFNVGDDLGEPWSSQADIPSLESSLSFDADTGIVTYIYVDSSTNFTQARLLVQKQSLANSTAYTIICNDTSTLSSATMTCDVGNESGFYIASSYIKRTGEALDLQITFQIEDFSSVAGFLGLFFGWFLILIASFMFKFNEIAGIWATTVTIFLINLIGLIKFGAVFVTAIIGIAIILTWVMEK